MSTRRGAKLYGVLVVLAVMLAGCPGADPEPPPPAPTPEGPAPEGIVRVGYPAEPPTLNPVAGAGASAATRDLLRPMLPSLFTLGADLRPQPDLVARWPTTRDISADPFSVTLRLRPARWSDGEPITAEDVRFTWERLRDGPARERYRLLRDVEVLDDHRLRLEFHRPMRRWWSLFSIDDGILPAHAFDEQTWERSVPVAGGPFTFDGWIEGLSIRLVPNPVYYGRRPAVPAVEVLFVPDDETRLQLLERGDLDVVVALGDGNVGARSEARGWPVIDGGLDGSPGASGAWGPAWWELVVDMDAMRDRPHLAQAIGTVLDRGLVAELLDDSGSVAHGIPERFDIGSTAQGVEDGAWTRFGADPQAARQLLADAGYVASGEALIGPRGEPVGIRLAHAREPTAAGIARLIHFQARQTGARVELIGIDAPRFERDWLAGEGADAYLVLRRGSDAPDVTAYRSDADVARNPSRVRSADLDRAIDLAETTVASRSLGRDLLGVEADGWEQAQRELAEGYAVYPLAFVRAWIVSAGGIAGPRATGAASGPFWNLAHWERRG